MHILIGYMQKDIIIIYLWGKSMKVIKNYDEAVFYCEDHECDECSVYLEDLDKRTRYEKESLHIPCCRNLVGVVVEDI